MKELFCQIKPIHIVHEEQRRELPCKDMDLDCLIDEHGNVPFGSYVQCYLYDVDKGSCPFLPF